MTTTSTQEFAAAARAKMGEIIESGRAAARNVWQQVRANTPRDRIARGSAMRFGYAAPAAITPAKPYLDELAGADVLGMMLEDAPAPAPAQPESSVAISPLVLQVADETSRIHNHALGQIAQRAGVPAAYLRELVASTNPALRALGTDILNRHFTSDTPAAERYLLRDVRGEVRGVLSDAYKRLDNRPLVEAFAEGCRAAGAVASGGTYSDLRAAIKAYLPQIFEPVQDEPMLLGLEWHNSDFGAGALEISLIVLRLVCRNGATMASPLRKVHLGSRLNDDISYSQRTYELDTRATASAIRDAVADLLSPPKVAALGASIAALNEQHVTTDWIRGRLSKKLGKGELEKVLSDFAGPDVVNLPPVQSVWRASNAVSWLANSVESPDRKLDLERIAGEMLRAA